MGRPFSRRRLLSLSAGVTSLFAAGAGAKTITGAVPWEPDAASKPDEASPGPYRYLTTEEAAFLDAAVARLIPKDELGPGALEAGATVFIDRQLAGPYGEAATWYMQGPWPHGAKTQGYQSRLTPAQLYRAGIKATDDHCRSELGKVFAALDAAIQDRVLGGLEKGEIALAGADAQTFFEMLLQNTIEGFFSDPIHGGNRDMVGWKLIGFPGARYNYLAEVSKHNQRLALKPVGLKRLG